MNKPVPLTIPFNVNPLVTVGLFPNGKLQSLFIVFLVWDGLVKVIRLNATLPQLNTPLFTPKLTVPPFAWNVGVPVTVRLIVTFKIPPGASKVPPVIVRFARLALFGRVNVPEFKVTVLLEINDEYELKFAFAPETIKFDSDMPVKPERTAPLFNVKVPLLFVSVPLPVKVPLTVKAYPAVPRLGLEPRGRVQSDPTVVVFVVLLNVTRLKVTLLHVSVAPIIPLKLIVPPFALNVGVPEMTKNPPTFNIPDGALNVPPVICNVLCKFALFGKVREPEVKVVVTVTLKVE